MRKSIAIVTALFGAITLFATSAFANDTMDLLLSGQSLKVVYDTGDTLTVQFKSDGSFETNDGRVGSWTIEGDTLCQTVADGTSGCTTLAPGKKVGDSWRMKDIFGTEFTATIV